MKYLFYACFIFIAFDAQAMQCMSKPLENNIKAADVIFLGKVVHRQVVKDDNEGGRCWTFSQDKPTCGSKVADFAIEKVWKGQPELSKSASVFSKDGCYCLGHYFLEGEKYIIFAHKATADKKADFEIKTVCDGSTIIGYEDGAALLQQLDIFFKNDL